MKILYKKFAVEVILAGLCVIFSQFPWSHFGHTSVRKTVFTRFPNDLLKRKNGFVMRILGVAPGTNLSIYFYEPEGRGFESLLACQQKTA